MELKWFSAQCFPIVSIVHLLGELDNGDDRFGHFNSGLVQKQKTWKYHETGHTVERYCHEEVTKWDSIGMIGTVKLTANTCQKIHQFITHYHINYVWTKNPENSKKDISLTSSSLVSLKISWIEGLQITEREFSNASTVANQEHSVRSCS